MAQFSIFFSDLLENTLPECHCVFKVALLDLACPSCQALRSSLEGISGEGGWRIQLVGGGARDSASHDADILVTHPHHIVDGVVAILYETWVGQGRLVPREQGFCMMQVRIPSHPPSFLPSFYQLLCDPPTDLSAIFLPIFLRSFYRSSCDSFL